MGPSVSNLRTSEFILKIDTIEMIGDLLIVLGSLIVVLIVHQIRSLRNLAQRGGVTGLKLRINL